jgi:hypothetical protein
MRVYHFILLFFIFGCQNSETENDNRAEPISESIEIYDEHQPEMQIEENEDVAEFDLYCTEDGLITSDSVSSFISSDGLKLVNDAISFYRKIQTDSEMADFYFNFLFEAVDTIENVFFKYQQFKEEIDWYFLDDWNEVLGNCIPFMIYVHDNTFDGPCGYISNSVLLEKSELTSGDGDDTFFEVKIKCVGEYNSAYSGLHYEQIACDIATSTYGGGFHYSALKSLIKADTVSDLFEEELKKLAEYILSEEQIISFGYSKESVYSEIEQILNLKDSTNIDLTEVENLKLFMDTTSRKLYFNCLDGSCPP